MMNKERWTRKQSGTFDFLETAQNAIQSELINLAGISTTLIKV